MNDIDDERLRNRLRTADPAAGLQALGAPARTAVLERASAQDPDAVRRPAARTSIRLRVGLVGLASAAVVATVLVVMAGPGGSAGRVLALREPAGPTAASCLPLTQFAAGALAASSVALEGTVTSASNGAVQIRPDRFFRGGPADRVDLATAPSTVSDATVFRPGERVLIAAAGEEVTGCGLSGPASPELRAYYQAAFGG